MADNTSVSALGLQEAIDRLGDRLGESLRQELQKQHLEIQNELQKKSLQIEELTKQVKEITIYKQLLHGLSDKKEKGRL